MEVIWIDCAPAPTHSSVCDAATQTGATRFTDPHTFERDGIIFIDAPAARSVSVECGAAQRGVSAEQGTKRLGTLFASAPVAQPSAPGAQPVEAQRVGASGAVGQKRKRQRGQSSTPAAKVPRGAAASRELASLNHKNDTGLRLLLTNVPSVRAATAALVAAARGDEDPDFVPSQRATEQEPSGDAAAAQSSLYTLNVEAADVIEAQDDAASPTKRMPTTSLVPTRVRPFPYHSKEATAFKAYLMAEPLWLPPAVAMRVSAALYYLVRARSGSFPAEARALRANLSRPCNAPLLDKLASGAMAADDLVAMSAAELASPLLRAQNELYARQALARVMME